MAWELHAIEQTQLRRKYRVDGVGRPKFDFHTGSPWGGTIDSYDAVFRVNKVQLQTENRNAYSCKVGARVDFAINALTISQFDELVNCLLYTSPSPRD